MGTYVVLVNERPESRAALDWALRTVTQFPGSTNAELHVILGPSTDIPGGPQYVSPALSADVTGQLRDSGITHEVHSGAKDPVESVIAVAGEVNADLVVIGMQKRSATLKLIMGSYARDILADAPCPVVAVKE